MILRGVVSTMACLLLLGFCQKVYSNDQIFPPRPVAKASVDFDGKGFLIRGKRTFIVSAGIEYARVPRPLWRDRLLRFKRAGFNCIETYVFWNFHEAREGQFEFTGSRDLDAFLKLAGSLGLYAIVRVGPYSCAEWDSGGYPVWLRFKPNLQVRTDNAAFEASVTRWWSALLPVVAKNQIHRGGNVILVQLENEHPAGWGTDGLSNPYFQFLQRLALAQAIEVPYFFSGLNHGSEPAGSSPWSSAARNSPWFTTEFWCDWYNDYGETGTDVRSKDRATWKIVAYGGNGYNYYMAHGGSNFDYFNNDEDASSYDYGAAVGEAGDLRPEYYKFKRAAWFARSFQRILETSDNATNDYGNAASNPAVIVTARKSPDGSIIFLDNPSSSPQQTTVTLSRKSYPTSDTLTLAPGEIMPVVTDFPIIPGVTLDVAPVRILGILPQRNTTTLVIYGQPGTPAEAHFQTTSAAKVIRGTPALHVDSAGVMLAAAFPAHGVSDYSFETGGRRIRILAVNDDLADRTWFVDAGAKSLIVCGPSYAGETKLSNGRLSTVTEAPMAPQDSPAIVEYDSGDRPIPLTESSPPMATLPEAKLAIWSYHTATAVASPSFDARSWLSSSPLPVQMGADGDVSSYAWYRAAFTLPTSGNYTVVLEAARDHLIPFIDGKRASSGDGKSNSFTVDMGAGDHLLALFVSHSGRSKLYPYIGPISNVDAKGITGQAEIVGGLAADPIDLTQWRMMPASNSATGTAPPMPSAEGWKDYTVGVDGFGSRPGFAWFQTTLPAATNAAGGLVNFRSVDDNCWVYLNGKQVASHNGWNVPFTLSAWNGWNPHGPNVLSVLVQNTDGIGGLDAGASFTASRFSIPITHWALHGGPGEPGADEDWAGLARFSQGSGPCFFRSTFRIQSFIGAYAVWHVVTDGLSRGSVWVNRHNLGRYPQTTKAPGVYIPECWLQKGDNSIVIFDEEGNSPKSIRIEADHDASRLLRTVDSRIGTR